MNLELTPQQASLLAVHLKKHIDRVDNELIHTDKRQMQRDLAKDEAELLEILAKLRALTD
jgi:hypothetical protein